MAHTRLVPLTLLFVCTGNICRSPLAERLVIARSGPAADIRAHSAGIRAMEGLPMDGPSARLLAELGGDGRGHVGRQLSESMIAGADLILGAQTLHRDAVLRLAPTSLRRTFTLREFLRLAADLSPAPTTEQARALIGGVAGRRGLADPVPSGADDIADPYLRPLAEVRECAGQISRAIDTTLRLLGAARHPPG